MLGRLEGRMGCWRFTTASCLLSLKRTSARPCNLETRGYDCMLCAVFESVSRRPSRRRLLHYCAHLSRSTACATPRSVSLLPARLFDRALIRGDLASFAGLSCRLTTKLAIIAVALPSLSLYCFATIFARSKQCLCSNATTSLRRLATKS